MTTPTRSNPMSGGTEIKSLEQRIASIEKRNAARDEYIEWVNGDDGPLEGTMARAKWAAIKARHGLSPTPCAEAVPPLAGKERWFRDSRGNVREFPSRRFWYNDGRESDKTGTTVNECVIQGDTELDGPPPHGKPLAAQGKGLRFGAEWFDHHGFYTNGCRGLRVGNQFMRPNGTWTTAIGGAGAWIKEDEHEALSALNAAPPPPGYTEKTAPPPDDAMNVRAQAAWQTPEYQQVAPPVAMALFARAETQQLREDHEATKAFLFARETLIASQKKWIKELRKEIRTLAKQSKPRAGKGVRR